MLGKIVGAFIDKEKEIGTVITNTLDNLSEELDADFKDFFVTIQPIDDDFNFKMYVYHKVNGVPKFIREITLKEIVE
jgi:hypothetical protein